MEEVRPLTTINTNKRNDVSPSFHLDDGPRTLKTVALCRPSCDVHHFTISTLAGKTESGDVPLW